MKIYADNKKAYFNFQISDKYDAGIVLIGPEVKSIRAGKISLEGSYVILKNNELFLIGAKIAPYQPNNMPADYDVERPRKLLLQKEEIQKLAGKTREKKTVMVPLKIYDKNAKIKIEFGIGKGMKKIDKREVIKKRETDREFERYLKNE